ncbi:hypothetical protein BYT27DRAFT_7093150 [Phlegmacium glaucopus]|nr:hypothetical protein BYT27DRAFT_7093150 [Phlegmacium glaucopus]
MSEVNIVSSQIDVETIQVAWWGGFVVSSLYLLLSFCLGEETRDIFQWIRQQVTRERRFILPIQWVFLRNAPFSLPKMTQPPWSRTRPISVDHKSGWDDMLDVKVPKAKKGTGKTSAMVVSTCSSPTPTITTVVTEDEVFMTSTLSYLSSPTATTLGLSGPSVPRKVVELPPKPRISPPLSPTLLKATDNLVPTSPISPLPGLPASCYASRPRSHSLTSRSEETNVQASLHNCPTESPTASPKRPVLTSPSTRSLQSTWSRETLGHDRGV